MLKKLELPSIKEFQQRDEERTETDNLSIEEVTQQMNTATAPPKHDCYQAAPTINTERNWRTTTGTVFTSSYDGAMPQIMKTDDILGGDPRIEDHRIGVY